MGVSKNKGNPPKWMVKIMENPIKMDDLGVPLFLEISIYDLGVPLFLEISIYSGQIRIIWVVLPSNSDHKHHHLSCRLYLFRSTTSNYWEG